MTVTLTIRQEEVLRAVAEDMPNAAIAHDLGVTEATVKNRLYDTYQRLGVTTRIGALRARGYIVVPPAAHPVEASVESPEGPR